MSRPIRAVAASLGIALLASTGSTTAHADTALSVGGTNIPSWLSEVVSAPAYPLNEQYFASYSLVGIPYPGTIGPFSGIDTPTLGESVSEGVTNMYTAIHNTRKRMLVMGDSQGALVVDAVHAQVSNDRTVPPPSRLSFLVIADPNYGGVFSVLFPPGFTIPLVNYTIQAPVEDRYDVVVFKNEYDGAADFPDRPWNLVAVANAILGFICCHASTTSLNPYTIPPGDITVTTNSRGGTTTIYLNPAEHLPLTQPLRDIGLPAELLDWIDRVLRPIVDAGYSRNDKGPIHGPTLWGGELRLGTTGTEILSTRDIAGAPSAQQPTGTAPTTPGPTMTLASGASAVMTSDVSAQRKPSDSTGRTVTVDPSIVTSGTGDANSTPSAITAPSTVSTNDLRTAFGDANSTPTDAVTKSSDGNSDTTPASRLASTATTRAKDSDVTSDPKPRHGVTSSTTDADVAGSKMTPATKPVDSSRRRHAIGRPVQ
jgi:diacyltrehalose acyltransferase